MNPIENEAVYIINYVILKVVNSALNALNNYVQLIDIKNDIKDLNFNQGLTKCICNLLV